MKTEKAAYIRKLQIIGMFFLMPAGILILFTTVIPFFWNLVLSFGEWNGVSDFTFIGLENYQKILTTRVAKLAIKNSCIIAVVGTLVAMLLGIGMALMIYRVSKIEGAICRFVFYSPAMLPMTVVGLLFTFILSSKEGLLNGLLESIGLEELTQPWLATKTLVVVCIGVVQGWRCAGTIMMLSYTAIVALPADLFEESKLEGATYWQEVRHIIIPLVRPTVVMAFSMMSMWAFKTYDIVAVMTNGGPGDLSQTAPLYIINQTFQNSNFGFASALSIVFALIIMAIIAAIRFGLRSETHEF